MTMKEAKGAFFPAGMTGRLTGAPGSPDVDTPNVVQVRYPPYTPILSIYTYVSHSCLVARTTVDTGL